MGHEGLSSNNEKGARATGRHPGIQPCLRLVTNSGFLEFMEDGGYGVLSGFPSAGMR
jgi:hypothetical protein